MSDFATAKQIKTAAQQIRDADHLLILAGAGMGVDSGLPDFRGNEGFWNAYPPFKERGLSFYDLANPVWFKSDPAQAWGFYGHRLNLYRSTSPHAGFQLLKRWANSKKSHFVFTSNVDGHFQTSGFNPDNVIECHGSFSFLQCHRRCSDRLWPTDDIQPKIDPNTFLANEPLPKCPKCNEVARPNILMFGDSNWIPSHSERQHTRYNDWFRQIEFDEKLAIVEIGAGSAVPTVRYESESRLIQKGSALIRINPRESDGPEGTISIALGGLAGLNRLAQAIEKLDSSK